MYKKAANTNFSKQITSYENTVAVDFHAAWCPQCIQMSQRLDQVCREANIPLIRIDVDKEPELVDEYGIINVPSLLIFRNGTLKRTVSGIWPKETLKKMLK